MGGPSARLPYLVLGTRLVTAGHTFRGSRPFGGQGGKVKGGLGVGGGDIRCT